MLAALVEAAGAEVAASGHVADDAPAVRALLADLPGDPDLVVTSGGVSMGVYDTVKEVLARGRRGRLRQGRDAPGDAAGLRGRRPARIPIVTLPGNPVSSFASFHVFVLPGAAPAGRASTRMSTAPRGRRRHGAGTAAPGKVELTRVVEQAGRVRPSGGQGSHVLGALAGATALALVPADVTRVEPGDRLRCLPLLGKDRDRGL